eukprot:gene11561-24174_t
MNHSENLQFPTRFNDDSISQSHDQYDPFALDETTSNIVNHSTIESRNWNSNNVVSNHDEFKLPLETYCSNQMNDGFSLKTASKRKSRFSDRPREDESDKKIPFQTDTIALTSSLERNMDDSRIHGGEDLVPSMSFEHHSKYGHTDLGAYQESTTTDVTIRTLPDSIVESVPKQKTVLTEEEKALWKSCWAFVRKFLKPYLERGNIHSREDYEILGKKMAQKMFEKESQRIGDRRDGAKTVSDKGAARIKKYVRDYFDKHDFYQHQPSWEGRDEDQDQVEPEPTENRKPLSSERDLTFSKMSKRTRSGGSGRGTE